MKVTHAHRQTETHKDMAIGKIAHLPKKQRILELLGLSYLERILKRNEIKKATMPCTCSWLKRVKSQLVIHLYHVYSMFFFSVLHDHTN